MILVCVVILRLLAAILPSYEDRDAVAAARKARDAAGEAAPEEVADPAEAGATSETALPSPEEVGGAGESGE